jgi:hypothetical protein
VSYSLVGTPPICGYGQEPAITSSVPRPEPASNGARTLTYVAIGVGVVALVGLIAWSAKRRADRLDIIAQKEGSSGLLKAQAGEAAIGVGSVLAARAFDRNPRRRRRVRR